MKRSLQRPVDDDEDDYYGGSSFGSENRGSGRKSLNFVPSETASATSSKPSERLSRVNNAESENTKGPRPLTADERNALAAKILKAEMSGKKDRANTLKRKLELGVVEDDKPSTENGKSENQEIVLLKMDKKSGLVKPAQTSKKETDTSRDSKASKSTVMNSFEAQTNLDDMVAAEKCTTAEDQLNLFSHAIKMSAGKKTDDDWILDDNITSHKKKARHATEEARSLRSKNISEHKNLERTLNSCALCIDSSRFDKSTVVAVGSKTYLAVVPWKGLDDFHCRIVTNEHYASAVTVDEDVFEELAQMRKSLVAMFQERDEDCAFIETAKVQKNGCHMSVECIPMPKEIGDLLPIYFKQALENAGAQWSTHKKIFDLKSSKDQTVRSIIPKGFSYFAVDFGLEPGYAHVIEDPDKFPDYFGQEIVGGMIDADHKCWRNVEYEKLDQLKDKRDRFKDQWKEFDWTAKSNAE
ncbi:hypothetical protein M3Y98_00304800 [Aphelenchoides besseyi]|nr:hypothetical protein M3Y98_00304800 [Aphelenchoides besseyi]